MMELLKEFKIGKSEIGAGCPPYVIAEMACAHDGDVQKAKKIIDGAAEAGANAIQLQIFDLDQVVTKVNDLYEVLQNITLTKDEWRDLVEYSRSKKIDVLVCTYDLPSVEFTIELNVDGIKLNSADLSNPEVIAAVAKSGLPFTLGTGASTLEEISNGLRLASENGAKKVVLMHGVQNFPTKAENLNIQRIELLKDVFDIPVGYHDHIDGEDPFGKMVDLIAVGMGAVVIEKHITFDRSEKGLDYQAALEPAEFKLFVENIKKAHLALGSKELKPFTESELKYRKFQKKSIVAFTDMKKGHRISRKDVYFSRNNDPGVAPIYFEDFKDKSLKRDVSKFENITYLDIE